MTTEPTHEFQSRGAPIVWTAALLGLALLVVLVVGLVVTGWETPGARVICQIDGQVVFSELFERAEPFSDTSIRVWKGGRDGVLAPPSGGECNIVKPGGE